MIIDFTTVFGFICPLAYFLGFVWFSHIEYTNPKKPEYFEEKPGMGVTGLWLSIVVGYSYQMVLYWLLLLCSDWEAICKNALDRHGEMTRLHAQSHLEMSNIGI